MTPGEDLEKIYAWSFRHLGRTDPRRALDRLAQSDVLRVEGLNDDRDYPFFYSMAVRMMQGVVPPGESLAVFKINCEK